MIAILLEHLDAYEQTWGETKSFQILKKFFKLYINGWYGAAELRAHLMEAHTPDEVRAILKTVSVD